MRDVLTELVNAHQRKQVVALTALVETRGSTPQKPGATMLVFADGSQSGTLGGGCVEAEVKRHAIQLLDQGQREILTFNLDSDYGWDDGLICGGRMRMLVDPVRPGDDFSYFETLSEILIADRGCTEVIITDSERAGCGEAGDSFLVESTGEVLASRGAGHIPESLATALKPLSTRPRPYMADGMAFLPRLQRCRLVIVGAGHVGQKVAELAAEVDFDVWVVDDRDEVCSEERFPTASRRIVAPIDSALSGLEIDENTFCIIVTRGHNHDEEALYHLAESPARYIGMIGSRRKIKLIFEDLLKEGIAPEAIERVHAPLGFQIGSQLVSEIAVSIVAQLIACRNLGELPEQYHQESLLAEIPRDRSG